MQRLAPSKERLFSETWRRLKMNKVAMAGLVIFAFMVLIIIFADVIVSYEQAIKHNMINRLQPPSAENWFGTDTFGRDIFARIVHGSRTSLSIGIISVFFSLLLGGTIGSIAGFFGGKTDIVLMRVVDIFMSIPAMLMAISIVAVLGPGMRNLVIAISIAEMSFFAVLIRSAVLSIKNSEYIEAARSIGASSPRIILKHILPNAMAPIIVQSTLSMGGVILIAASLSFVGLGIMPPTPEWGAMLSEGRGFMRDHQYLVIFPGLAIMFAVLSLNFLGDGLRDALDPRLKQ